MSPSLSTTPLVSCIMPTYNRRAFVPYGIEYFLRQDYPQKELIILDDGEDPVEDLVPLHPDIRYHRLPKKVTLGAKMNLACGHSTGEIIVNWDDDDWYAPWRISYQVGAMGDGVAVSGINQLLYFDLRTGAAHQYRYPAGQKPWLLGSSLCFTREAWRKTPFADINVGMDGLFVWAHAPGQVRVLDDQRFAVHMIHGHNVSPKKTSGIYWESYPVSTIKKLLGADWHRYFNDGTAIAAREEDQAAPATRSSNAYKVLQHVYACLVHESPECIGDMIRNLRHHDPDSAILLYNGSGNPALLDPWMHETRNGVFVHPEPKPQEHGYLHGFALDCMRYCIRHLSFDLMTIVDSDQLCLRGGYVDFLSRHFAANRMVGMLSSNAAPVSSDVTDNPVAAQAFREWELWRPLFEAFRGPEPQPVHWTFWPGTVFHCEACTDLVNLFGSSAHLQQIMRETQIWATEEVILPTLIRMLGYTIADNPCSGDYVKYRQEFTEKDLRRARSQENAFWIHPVKRSLSDPLRVAVREHNGGYVAPRVHTTSLDVRDLLLRLRGIAGWMSDAEARLLIEHTRRLAGHAAGSCNVVETGSYHGKSTVLLGTVLRDCASVPWTLTAIDLHDGKLGAADQGLVSYPPSFDAFRRNLATAGLENRVAVHRTRATDLAWKEPVSLLLIDGLHDYENVSAEFRHFEPWLDRAAIVAFHDYADYFPGVRKLVTELLTSGGYREAARADTLIILERV